MVFSRRSDAAFGRSLSGARVGARRRRRGARGRRRARVARARGHGACAAAEQAQDVAASLGVGVGGVAIRLAGSWDLLVNCTPLGGAARRDESPLPGGPFDGRLVYDLTYGPANRALLREARGSGLPDAGRPADAGRAGGAAVRMVDGPGPAPA